MAANTFGNLISLTSFGESHGELIGGVLDGFPSGIVLDVSMLQNAINRRSPGKQFFSSPRFENDRLEIVSGIFENKTTGAPIAFFIRNASHKSQDYDHLKEVYRPSHSGYTYDKKYGHHDYRGGGRSSARETAVRVAAGAICTQLLSIYNIEITGYVSQIGPYAIERSYKDLDLKSIDASILRCPDPQTEERINRYLEQIKAEGDSAGGVVTCIISGVPAGIGEPVYQKIQSSLSSGMMSINAVKGFDYGSGFAAASMKGSEHNDVYTSTSELIHPATNHAGGILGGITTGEDIYFRVAFKPVSSIAKPQQTLDKLGNEVNLNIHGRHDVCIVPRAVPIVEAMAALVIADHLKIAGLIKNNI